MYYLMQGLESLPAYTGEVGAWLWRGISEEGRDRVVQESTLMRQVMPSRINDSACLYLLVYER